MRPFFFLGKDKIIPWVAVFFFKEFQFAAKVASIRTEI
jgi:hypothetical protein